MVSFFVSHTNHRQAEKKNKIPLLMKCWFQENEKSHTAELAKPKSTKKVAGDQSTQRDFKRGRHVRRAVPPAGMKGLATVLLNTQLAGYRGLREPHELLKTGLESLFNFDQSGLYPLI